MADSVSKDRTDIKDAYEYIFSKKSIRSNIRRAVNLLRRSTITGWIHLYVESGKGEAHWEKRFFELDGPMMAHSSTSDTGTKRKGIRYELFGCKADRATYGIPHEHAKRFDVSRAAPAAVKSRGQFAPSYGSWNFKAGAC